MKGEAPRAPSGRVDDPNALRSTKLGAMNGLFPDSLRSLPSGGTVSAGHPAQRRRAPQRGDDVPPRRERPDARRQSGGTLLRRAVPRGRPPGRPDRRTGPARLDHAKERLSQSSPRPYQRFDRRRRPTKRTLTFRTYNPRGNRGIRASWKADEPRSGEAIAGGGKGRGSECRTGRRSHDRRYN